MDKPLSNGLRLTFLIHAIAAILIGLALLLVPGRSLNLLGWVQDWVQLPNSDQSIPGLTFVDPLITRMLGAALVALAFLSFRAWQKSTRAWGEVRLVVEFEAVICALSLIAILLAIFTMQRTVTAIVWVSLLVYAAFFVAWGLAWQAGRK